MVLRPRNNWVWTVSALTQPRPEGCPPRFSAFYPLSGLISVTRTCSDHTGSVSSWLFSLEGFGTTGRTQQCWLLGLGRVQEGRGGLSLSVVVGTEVWWGQACPELSSQPRLLGKAHSSLCPCQFWEQGKWGRLLCFLRKLRQETRQAPGSPGPMLEVNLRSLGSGPCGAESRQLSPAASSASEPQLGLLPGLLQAPRSQRGPGTRLPGTGPGRGLCSGPGAVPKLWAVLLQPESVPQRHAQAFQRMPAYHSLLIY